MYEPRKKIQNIGYVESGMQCYFFLNFQTVLGNGYYYYFLCYCFPLPHNDTYGYQYSAYA